MVMQLNNIKAADTLVSTRFFNIMNQQIKNKIIGTITSGQHI